ncbi:MAG TPA: O-antigen ligase family protein [Chthonomonadaceae bacterium]|nr:O-antigen ligase family protein [Chthonomonadaceae bacterium]
MHAAASPPPPKASSYWQETAHNRILLVVLGMVVLVPLLASPSNEAMQGLANKALQVMAALLAGILVLRARLAASRAEIATFLATGANLAVILYLIATVVSLLLEPADPALRRLGMAELQRVIVGVLLYFALAYHVRRSSHLEKIQDALVRVSALMAIMGLSVLVVEGSDRALLFGNQQLFGAFLMILLPVPLVAALTERDARRQIIAQVSAALTVICLLTSGLRSGWLGALASLAALAIFSLFRPPRRLPTSSNKAQYVIPLLTVLFCAVFAVWQGDAGRVIQMRLNLESRTQSLAEREVYWRTAEYFILTKPVFGMGLGTYPVYQYPYTLMGRPGIAVLHTRPTLAEMAHQVWLQTAAEQGLIGVSLFAGIVLTFLVSGLRRLRSMEPGIRRTLLLACMAGMVGFTIDGLSNPAWQFAQISMFFWLILGTGVACLRPRPSRQD